MFCKNCGQKQTSTDSKFCHNCGKALETTETASSADQTKISTPGMTAEQYMAHTNIKSVDEAKKYLLRLRILFVSVFIGMILTRAAADIDVDVYALIFWAYLALLVYFVVYCVIVLRAEKISRANAIFTILLAPLSWIWFYPEIVEPLKIIAGEKLPPASLSFSKEQKMARQESNKLFWKKFIIFIVACIGAVTILSVWLYFYFQSNGSTNTTNSNQSTPANYEFTSIDQKFSITFPDQPQQKEEVTFDEDIGQTKTITYSSSKNEMTYYVFIYEYSDPRIDDTLEDFNVSAGLEGALNGMLNNVEDTKLISSNFEQLLGKGALKYEIRIDSEILKGILLFNGNRLYNISLDYFTDNDTLSTDIKLSNFINSFKFNP